MRSVADILRTETARRVQALGVEERIALALRLGDSDLRVFSLHSGLAVDEARLRLRASRQHGRRQSVTAFVPR